MKLAGLVAATISVVVTALAAPASGADRLHDDAQQSGRSFGTALSLTPLDDVGYANLVRQHAGVVTPENDMKWEVIHPERGRYDFTRADRIVEFARANGWPVHGHALAWHNQNPAWLTALSPSRDEAMAILRDHIFTVVGHFRSMYPGVVTHWDVVNEAIDEDGRMRPNIWLRWIGRDYVDLAFRWAREAGGPDVKLLYNDYIEGYDLYPSSGPLRNRPCSRALKCRGIQRLVEGLVARGVPIDGVGVQGHLYPPILISNYRALTAWIAPLGLEWWLSELDVRIYGADAKSRAAQARAYRAVTTACTSDPACAGVITWGLSDRYTWLPSLLGGIFGRRGLPFDGALRPVQAYTALRDALRTAPVPYRDPARPRP